MRKKNGLTRVAVTIRLPKELVTQIDAALDDRSVPLSRNNWLLEAAVEKLTRSREKGGSNGAE